MRIALFPVAAACAMGAVVLVVGPAHAVPECVRDNPVPRQVPPPADDWVASPRRAAGLLADAQEAFEAGDSANALKLVERAIATDNETNPAARVYYSLRAACLQDLGNARAAEATTHYNAAQTASQRGDYGEARRLYERALRDDQGMLWAANNRAWLAATHPDPDARDDPDALAYALYACAKSDWHNWSFIDTLGAVYAEKGDYETAIRCAGRALALAPDEQANEVRSSLAKYRSKQPRRDDDADALEDPFADSGESKGHQPLLEQVTLEAIAETMRREGWAISIREGRFIEWRIEGYKTQIFLGDNGKSIQFHAAFGDEQVALAKVNEWNRTKRFSKSYLDNEGNPHIELDLDYGGGITEARVVGFLRTCRLSFERWLKEVVD